MKKLLLSGAVATLAVAGAALPAQAQDYGYDPVYRSAKDQDRVLGSAIYAVPEEPVEQAQVYEVREAERVQRIEPAAGPMFTGPYAGGEFGHTWGEAEVEGGDDVDLDDWEGGVFAGYSFADMFVWMGMGYAALEAGYNWSAAEDTANGLDYEKKSDIRVTLKPGMVFNDNMIGYGIAGWSRAEFEAGAADENLDGLVLGLGTEVKTEWPVGVRVEYAYVNYEDEDLGGAGFDADDHGLKAGVTWRF